MKHFKQNFLKGLGLFSLTFIIVSYQNCSAPFDAITEKAVGLSSEPPPVEPGQQMTFAGMQAAESKLATTTDVTGSISSLDGFSGLVNLSIDRSGLDLIDAEQNVRVAITPSTVNLPANGSANFTISVTTDDMAPSFNLAAIQLKATDPSGVSLPATINMNLRVQPLVELRMNGNADPLLRWDRPTGAMNFRNHASGLTVRFINVDAASSHVVHGNGDIPHGPTGAADEMQSPANDGEDGGVYEVVIAAGTVSDGSYYYHDLGPDGDERDMFFGVASSASAFTNRQNNVSAAFLSQMNGKAMPADTPGCAVGDE